MMMKMKTSPFDRALIICFGSYATPKPSGLSYGQGLSAPEASGKDIMTTVGYVMKRSREEDFAKLQEVDAILYKATDEIMAVEMGSPAESAKKNTFTRNMEELQRYIECQSGCCVIDPFSYIHPVLDWHKIQQILLGLENLKIKGHCKIRCSHFLKVDCFNEPNLEQRLVEAKLPLPNMVKPQVACGVADAHSMAIVFKVNDYEDLDVPLPAVVQIGLEGYLASQFLALMLSFKKALVIVDVNYLPSLKEVPDDIAIPAFWEALKEKIDSEKSKQPTKASWSNWGFVDIKSSVLSS